MKSNKTRFCIFLVGPVHCPQNLQVQILTNFSLKLSHTALFTHLKIIFIIVFSVFSNKRYPNRSLVFVWQRLFLSIYFTIQFIFGTIHGLIALFGTIYGSHCFILVNFYFYLQYFQQKKF